MTEPRPHGEAHSINLTWIGMLYGLIWSACRLVCAVSLSVFIAIYFFLAIPSDYEVQPVWLIAQPILLGSVILSWRAAGHPIRSLGALPLALLILFAASFVQIVTSLLNRREAIVSYSKNFPDPRWHELLSRLGPDGPFIFFLGATGGVALVLILGAIAALYARFWRVGKTGMTLRNLSRRVRETVANFGDAPSLFRLLDWYRWKGWIAGAAAGAVLLLPLLLPGREFQIPGTGGIYGALPDLVARLVTFANDRLLALTAATIVALLLWRLARWLTLADGRIVLDADKRPPMLLLRSFRDDHATVLPIDLWRRLLHPLLWPIRFLLFMIGAHGLLISVRAITRRRLEEVAARSLTDAGPFIAVGGRGEGPPELGAFRAHVTDDEWQYYVKRWLTDARIVVLVAGLTPSVRWELTTAAEIGALDKVILLIPPGAASEIIARWRYACESLVGTAWHERLIRTDPRSILAVRFAEAGRIAAISSWTRSERQYDLAVRIGQGIVVA